MVSFEQARRLALSFPEASEQSHHGFPSFRIRNKIFATAPDPDHLNIMIGEEDIRAAVAEDPGSCEELWWGRRLAAVRVSLDRVDQALLAELLSDAWRRKAPAGIAPRPGEPGPPHQGAVR